MSSSAVCLVFLLCSMAVQIDGTPPSLTFTNCGSNNMCRNQPNVVCPRGSCKCSRGYIGNGNIACVDPDESCLCTMARDPHVVSNIGRRFRLPIPCAHRIAEFTTPVIGGMGNCTVQISGLAYNPKFNNSLNFYERKVDIRVTMLNYDFRIQINSGQDAIINGSWFNLPISSSNGNTLITMPECGLEIAYRTDGSFFSLRTSRNASGDGICDNCQQYGQGKPDNGDVLDDLLYQLSHQTMFSPVDGQDINRVGWCDAVFTQYNICPESRRYNATRFCGGFLVDRNNTGCVESLTMSSDLASRATLFNNCMSQACDPTVYCDDLYYNFWASGCPSVNLYILWPPFCTFIW